VSASLLMNLILIMIAISFRSLAILQIWPTVHQ
jgi:hypothetical protein